MLPVEDEVRGCGVLGPLICTEVQGLMVAEEELRGCGVAGLQGCGVGGPMTCGEEEQLD